ncbi:uncharacterized protein NECHADRAFT_88830 [Fusarium vanettenii 77-13-4]|uniref:C2H2-type domain-containing protein n=1 Tax=Fusarium vanettenii (strain ATCC MYA-4622 / CBS 123669 / FGSC 9596 / NRRL 45880 / 77-13-4) TaxID=660122 RepID=C7ZN72_FUSV7|nr:uncharacterized protein NECHADRAFT_88830 [Fusarium vanettenii 77-13-4]EEU34546.1 predicted protein [Fusarium vanettenii 77-13-4]
MSFTHATARDAQPHPQEKQYQYKLPTGGKQQQALASGLVILFHHRSTLLHETCGGCNKVFAGEEITRHQIVCRAPVTFTCDKCDKAFPRKELLRKHKRNVHRLCACGEPLKRAHERICELARSSGNSLNVSRPTASPTASPTDTQAYTHQAAAKLEESRQLIDELLSKGSAGLREGHDAKKFGLILRDADIGTPLTAVEYLAKVDTMNGPTTQYVLCSMDEAELVLRHGPCKLPILVPAAMNTNPNPRFVGLPWYLSYLESQPAIDVHDFGAMYSEQGHQPQQWPSQDATRRFREPEPGDCAINLLNLAGVKKNPVPECLVNIPDYHIITDVSRSGNGKRMKLGDQPPKSGKRSKGKAEGAIPIDLTASTHFQLLATRGAMHLPHVDLHHVITTAFCEDGEKLWVTWPGLHLEDLKKWLDTGVYPANGIALYLEQGSTMVQPGTTLHAPLSLTNVLMTGTMHWHPKSMVRVMEASRFELENPHVTNEEMSGEFRDRVQAILAASEANSGPWTCLSKDELAKCKQELTYFHGGCPCTISCQNCRCKKRGGCDNQCHHGEGCPGG